MGRTLSNEEVFYCEYCHMTEECDEECECDECMIQRGQDYEGARNDTYD